MTVENAEVTGHLNDGPAIDYFDEPMEIAPPATLERLMALAVETKQLTKQINDDTVALEELKAKLDRLEGMTIPDVMAELGMAEFTLTDGSIISVKDDIRTSIKVEDRERAWVWLEEHNCDGIIKTKVVSEFARGKLDDAKELVKKLAEAGTDANLTREVHPATLKSFVKERIAEDLERPADDDSGERLPRDIFSVYEFKRSKIEVPKLKKGKKKP